MQALLNFLAALRNTAKDAFKVELSGSILANDPATGDPVELTAIQDTATEKWYLGIASATESAAYDAVTGSIKTQPIGKKAKVTMITATVSTDVVASGSLTITVVPTAGYMAKMISQYIVIPAPTGGGSGTHEVKMSIGGEEYGPLVLARSVFSSGIEIRRNIAQVADNAKIPSTESIFQNNIMAACFTVANPLIIVYANGTNVNQTADLVIRLCVLEEAII